MMNIVEEMKKLSDEGLKGAEFLLKVGGIDLDVGFLVHFSSRSRDGGMEVGFTFVYGEEDNRFHSDVEIREGDAVARHSIDDDELCKVVVQVANTINNAAMRYVSKGEYND